MSLRMNLHLANYVDIKTDSITLDKFSRICSVSFAKFPILQIMKHM